MMFASDLIGPSEQIVERLHAERALEGLTELRFELAYRSVIEDYQQILSDVVDRVAPELGWKPAVPGS